MSGCRLFKSTPIHLNAAFLDPDNRTVFSISSMLDRMLAMSYNLLTLAGERRNQRYKMANHSNVSVICYWRSQHIDRLRND